MLASLPYPVGIREPHLVDHPRIIVPERTNCPTRSARGQPFLYNNFVTHIHPRLLVKFVDSRTNGSKFRRGNPCENTICITMLLITALVWKRIDTIHNTPLTRKSAHTGIAAALLRIAWNRRVQRTWQAVGACQSPRNCGILAGWTWLYN